MEMNCLICVMFFQISYSASSKLLSNKKQFPYFIRTYSRDLHWISALVHLVVHFGWKYVGALAVDDEYGRNGRAQFVSEAQQRGVCIAFQENWKQIIQPEDIERVGEKGFWLLS